MCARLRRGSGVVVLHGGGRLPPLLPDGPVPLPSLVEGLERDVRDALRALVALDPEADELERWERPACTDLRDALKGRPA